MELSDAPEKNPQWPQIDPGTLRLVVQFLNHYVIIIRDTESSRTKLDKAFSSQISEVFKPKLVTVWLATKKKKKKKKKISLSKIKRKFSDIFLIIIIESPEF
jgi:hypothetical protein